MFFEMLTPLQVAQLNEQMRKVAKDVLHSTNTYRLGRMIYDSYRKEREVGHIPKRYQNAYARQFGTTSENFGGDVGSELPDDFMNYL